SVQRKPDGLEIRPTGIAQVILARILTCSLASDLVALAAGDDAKLAADPLIAGTELRDERGMIYEEAKAQYGALLRAFLDKTGI
ncbi:MAG: hypothetical protein K2R98_30785, partial [Gemmataceae bacterium]|nr:hypothetical protein [Gemmataceae bacterium]